MSGIDITALLIEACLVVVGVLLYLLLKQMRELRDAMSTSPDVVVDTTNLEAVMAKLEQMVSDRLRGDTLRQTNLEVASALSANDRIQLTRLVALMNIVDDKVTTAATHAVGVAEDLAKSHERANEAEGPSGAAADAASKTA